MSQTLYFAAGSCSLPALVSLEEAGAPFDTVRLVLADGDQRRPEYLAIHPRGRVPALDVGGRIITENTAILPHLARRYPQAPILPLDDEALLDRAHELIGWFASGVHIAFATIFRTARFVADEAAWPAVRATGRDAAVAAIADLDQLLSDGRPWILGDRVSALDPYAVVFWRWATRIDLDTATYPAFHAHAQRVVARPAVVRALAHETSTRTLVAA